MHEYKLYYSEYSLRSYEKTLALKEVDGILPNATKKITRNFVRVCSERPIPRQGFEKLTFFSKISGLWNGVPEVICPHQNLWERSLSKARDVPKKNSREIRYLTHSIHEYKGRFYPQLVRSFLNWANVKKSHTVLDPFCGCGTTLLECALYPVNGIGFDINPISKMIATAKTKSIFLGSKTLLGLEKKYLNPETYTEWRKENLKTHSQHVDMEFLLNWFPQNNLKKILHLVRLANEHRNHDVQGFLHTIISNLIREYSWQDPRDLRTRRRTASPPKNFFEAFQADIVHQIQNIRKFQEINNQVKNTQIKAQVGDARNLPLRSSSIDTIITSPPYATALPYIDTDRLSLAVMGFLNRTKQKNLERNMIGTREIRLSEKRYMESLFTSKKKSDLPWKIMRLIKEVYELNENSNVGFRRKNTAALLYRYFMDMKKSLSEMHRVIKKGGYIFMVVGSNRTCAGNIDIDIPTFEFVNLIAESCGFSMQQKINMPPQKSYTIYSKNAIPDEAITLLQKR